MAPDPFDLLVASCRAFMESTRGPRRSGGDALRGLVAGAVDWETVLNAAAGHGLLPIFTRTIVENCGSLIGEVVARRLERERRESAVRSLAAASQLADVVVTLRAAGVAALPYKGPSLSLAAYGDVALRSPDDLDIVVRPADGASASAALFGVGYTPVEGATWREMRAAGDWRGHATLWRAHDELPVELHWRFCDRKLPWNPGLAGVMARSGTVSIAHVPVPVPAAADQVALVLLHAARHGWDRLEPIVCAGALLAGGVDPSEVVARAADVGGRRACEVGLAIVDRILGVASVPIAGGARSQVVEALVDDGVRRLRAGDAGDARDARLHLTLLDDSLARWRYLALAALLPTGEDRAAVRLPRALDSLYPLVRLGRLGWRAAVRVSATV